MNWCFAKINNKLAEVYFEEKQGEMKIFSHCLVKKSEYKTKKELNWIDKDIKKFRIIYKKGKYWRKDPKRDKLICLKSYSHKELKQIFTKEKIGKYLEKLIPEKPVPDGANLG